ncbi:cellulose biosynthesis protein BcsG [Aeromonas veronii]
MPETPWVAENQGATVIEYQDKNYIKLGKGEWVPYPR